MKNVKTLVIVNFPNLNFINIIFSYAECLLYIGNNDYFIYVRLYKYCPTNCLNQTRYDIKMSTKYIYARYEIL